MLDWIRSLLGSFTGNRRKRITIEGDRPDEGKGKMRKTRSEPAMISSASKSSLKEVRRGARDDSSGRSIGSLKNETFMLEAQRLFLALGIAMTSGGKNGRRGDNDDDDDDGERRNYRNLDVIYHHPQGNGRVFVGNDRAAGNLAILQRNKITHIVNCTRPARAGTLPNHHANNPRYRYYEFPAAVWNEYVMEDDRGNPVHNEKQKMLNLMRWIKPLFHFIKRAIIGGNNVLIHCLAGAHRAGTTGVLTLMYFLKLSADEALKMATSIRPVINPISDFPDLLKLYEMCQKNKIDRDAGAAAAGVGGGGKGKGRDRNISFSLSSVQDLTGNANSGPNTSNNPYLSLVRSQSTGGSGGDDQQPKNPVAAQLLAKTNAIQSSLQRGKESSTAMAASESSKKKGNPKRRRSLDSEKAAAAAQSTSSWLKYQQTQATKQDENKGAGSVKFPVIKDALKKSSKKNDRGSRRSFDQDHHPTLKATASQPQLRRSSLGSIPKLA